MVSKRRSKKSKSDHAVPGAVIYCRVSTTKQARIGVSIEAQEAACRAHCARMGWKVLAVHIDAGFSGKLAVEKRPGLKATIEAMHQHPGAAVVVYSLSRLARSQRMIWNLLDERGEYRLPVSSATEPFDTISPMGRAFLGMLATFAQLEADLASERTIDALETVREQGTKLGRPSMLEGTDEDGKRVIDPQKLALVRRLKAMYATEKYTHRSLAEKLNSDGIASVTGGKWWPKTIRTALNLEV